MCSLGFSKGISNKTGLDENLKKKHLKQDSLENNLKFLDSRRPLLTKIGMLTAPKLRKTILLNSTIRKILKSCYEKYFNFFQWSKKSSIFFLLQKSMPLDEIVRKSQGRFR